MLTLEDNRDLQARGWRVFRSATRDHLVPITGVERVLQRIRITEALPVAGVRVGAEALGEEQRAEVRSARERVVEEVTRLARERPTGETSTLSFSVSNVTPNPGPAGNVVDDVLFVGSAPFSGFITEVTLQSITGGLFPTLIAIRTGSGASLFLGGQTFSPLSQNINHTPDFILVTTDDKAMSLRRVRVPVLAGEEVFVVVRTQGLAAPGSVDVFGTLTFESAEGAPVGARAALSAIGANRAAVAAATRQAFIMTKQLELERERTARAVELARLKVEQARALAEARRPAYAPVANPFQQLLLRADAQALLQRAAPPPPPPPRVPPPPEKPPEGAGKTFVSAWLPQAGAIGYLTPTPKRGERVNVFDGKYTIWDVTGKKVGEGPVEMVSSAAGIPPGARISRELPG